MTSDELNKKVDADIAALEEALRKKYDRRQDAQQHEPEQRGGFDRRARVAPLNK